MGSHHLRVQSHGKTQLLAHKIEIFPVVFGISYAGYGVLGTHFSAHKASQHIKLVRAGGRHKQIGLFHRGFPQCSAIGAVSANPDDIIDVGDFGYNVGIGVHNHHIVSLAYKAGDHRCSDFSATDNNNIHTRNSLLILKNKMFKTCASSDGKAFPFRPCILPQIKAFLPCPARVSHRAQQPFLSQKFRSLRINPLHQHIVLLFLRLLF